MKENLQKVVADCSTWPRTKQKWPKESSFQHFVLAMGCEVNALGIQIYSPKMTAEEKKNHMLYKS